MTRKLIGYLPVVLLLILGMTVWARGESPPPPEPEPEPTAVEPTGPTTKYNEAPMLAAKVAAGELASVDERLPQEPSVAETLDEIGQYSGTLNVFATGPDPWQDFADLQVNGGRYLTFNSQGELVGDLLKDYGMSDDYMSLTLYLRPGLKWSDGAPFTAADIDFLWNDLRTDPNLNVGGNPLGPVKQAVMLDDYSIRLDFVNPSPNSVFQMASAAGGSWLAYKPLHYLKKWHIKYNPDAEDVAKEEGFDTWWQALYSHYWWNPLKDLELPTTMPWILKTSTTTVKQFERNPYYWQVDEDGNQLPYFDRITSTIVDPEVYQIKIISGEADAAYMFTSFANYTLYKENEDAGGYKTYVIPGPYASDVGLPININNPDPIKSKLFNDVRFRTALSVAINRNEMNDVTFHGQAVPRQATIISEASYYEDDWGKAHTEYDPARAARLLDEVGLGKKDRDGFRLASDGKPLTIIVEYGLSDDFTGLNASMLELLKEYWEDVGIRTLLKKEDAALIRERRGALDHDIIAETFDGATEIRNVRAAHWNVGKFAPAWGAWLDAKEQVDRGAAKLADFEGAKLPGEEPPDWAKELRGWINTRETLPIGTKQYNDLSKKIYDFHAKNIYLLGTVGQSPWIFIAKSDIKNIPEAIPKGGTWAGDLSNYCPQLFKKQ